MINPSHISSPDVSRFDGPSQKHYVEATATYNLLADLQPYAATVARSTDDVVSAVRQTGRALMKVAVLSTGHAASGMPELKDTLLIKTAFDAPVRVDPHRRIATIPAGARWGDVVPLAAQYGLAAMHGSSPTVGPIGFLLRGGLSFYGRKNGIASNTLRSITLVTSEGEVVKVDADNQPDVFWAMRGGGGGFGVVVEVEVELFSMWQIITGAIAFDGRDAERLVPLWRDWTVDAPDEVTTSMRMMNLPALPGVPEALTGRPILILDGAVTVQTPGHLEQSKAIAARLLEPLAFAATPLLDTWHLGSLTDLPATHMDPPDPIPYIGDHFLLDGMDDAGIARWLGAVGAQSDSVLLTAELRQLGGAFTHENPNGGAMNRIGGEFATFNVGVPGGPATPELIRAHQLRVRDALAAYDTGFTAPTFVESGDAPHRTLPAEVEARVDTIRASIDPVGMFAPDVLRATIR